jgi:hypothetical protein
VQGLGDRAWVGWDVGLVEYQYEGGRKGIAKCSVHRRMKQIYLVQPWVVRMTRDHPRES